MQLDKRYFDVVAADGAYLIAYDAAVRLGPASLRYRSLLSSSPRFPRSCYSLGGTGQAFPVNLTFGEAIQWQAPAACPTDIKLSAGPIEWRLDQIGFPVRVAAGENTITGRGYAETVRLKLPPWRLGIRSIRWGRFIGERSWAVWNIVEGAWPYRLFAVDGVVSDTLSVAQNEVVGAPGIVELSTTVNKVSDGDIVQSELSAVAPLVQALAGGRFVIYQCKKVRTARLVTRAGDAENGLAMDEFVEIAGVDRS